MTLEISSEANDFLLGGAGGKSATFPEIGSAYVGDIVGYKMSDVFAPGDTTPKTWDNGEKQRQMIVTLQTALKEDEDDNGIRKLYVKGLMKRAVADALFKAGVKSMDDAIGGKLAIKYVKDGEKKNKAFNAPKIYEAAFKPGARKQAVADLDDLLNTPAAKAEPEKLGLDQMSVLSNLDSE